MNFKKGLMKLGKGLGKDLTTMKKGMRKNWAGRPTPVAGRRPKLPKMRQGSRF